jgi:hypothetical protein
MKEDIDKPIYRLFIFIIYFFQKYNKIYFKKFERGIEISEGIASPNFSYCK